MRRWAWLVLAGAVLAGGWLRLHGLPGLALDDDEIYSWYDVQRMVDGEGWPAGAASHPLVYLGMAASAAVWGLSEGSLRVFPALCGLLAPLLFLVLRRDVIGRPAASVACGLAALSPWLVHASQSARFYAPQLAFAVPAVLLALPGRGQRMVLAWCGLILAALCHPSAWLLAPALVLPLLVPRPRWRALLLICGLALAVTSLLWARDPGDLLAIIERVRRSLDPAHYDLRHFVLGVGYNVGPMLLLLAAGGLFARRPGRLQLLASASLPLLLLALLGLLGTSVHQRYGTVALPALLVLAGQGAEAWSTRRPVLGALALGLAAAAFVPGLLAHASDGNRHDARALVAALAERVASDAILVADEQATLELYLLRHPRGPDLGGVTLVEDSLMDERKRHDFLGNRREVWVVLKASRLASTYDPAFMDWVRGAFTEVLRVGAAPAPLVRHDNRWVVFQRTERRREGRRGRGQPWP